jgi:aryl-alcohol dehydrogenase-like predicted oxidoreductase
MQGEVNRRQFIKSTLASSVLASLSPVGGQVHLSEKPLMKYGILGRTGQRVSRLGVGGGIYIRGSLTRKDMEIILETAVELGINYVDTAPAYNDLQAQIGPTVKRIRDRIFLVSKVEECTYQGAWCQLKQSLKDLQTDHLDLVHLHSLGNEDRWPDLSYVFSNKGALCALREAKQQGLVRFIGASGHNYPSRFHAALDTGEIDVLMNAVNFVVQHSYDFEHKLWSRAYQQNIGLVAMKVLGGATAQGKGFRIPVDLYEKAIYYALSLPGVCTAVIGFEDPVQVEEAASAVARFEKLSDQEMFSLYQQGFDLLLKNAYFRAPWGRPIT